MQKKFRIQYQNIGFTYSQCDVPLEDIMQLFKNVVKEKFGWAVICHEDHPSTVNDENHGVHRHAYLYLCKKPDWSDGRKFDIQRPYNPDHVHQDGCKIGRYCNYHPKIEPIKGKQEWLKYVIEDGIYIVDGTLGNVPFSIDSFLESHTKKTSYGYTWTAKQMKEGKTLDQIDDVAEGFIASNKRKLEEYGQFLVQKQERQIVRPKFKGVVIGTTTDKAWIKIINWTHINFLKSRKFKQKQLWIWGADHNIGKSFFFLKIMSCYKRMYPWVKGDAQDGGLVDAEYILLDEFCGAVPINDLKRLSQMGGDYSTRIRYGGIHTISKNMPLVVTSQKSIRNLYHNCSIEDVEALQCRFEEIHVQSIFEMVPIARDIDYPNHTYPWYEPNEESIESDEFIDPSTLMDPMDQPLNDELVIQENVVPIQDTVPIDDSYEDHSEHSNEENGRVSKRKKK